uniref:Uncharacterized protein n=1 Tax=Salix viminalis TaxID=40686 RepID=A0A6N2KT96_SALVM
MRSQIRIRSGANNSLGPLDLGEALDLTVVHLWETCLSRPCALPGLVRPSGLDTRDTKSSPCNTATDFECPSEI